MGKMEREPPKCFDELSGNLYWQPLLCAIFIFLVLAFLAQIHHDGFLWAAGASSLASSAFIVFVSPNTHSAKWQRILGGYFLAAISGEIMRAIFLGAWVMFGHHYFDSPQWIFWMAAALAVSMALFLMVVFCLQHPPACGIALILVVYHRNFVFLAIVLLSSWCLSLLRYLLRRQLQNLF